jgi:glycosyltransferase involved in cell wall biosynthesis
MGRHTLVFDIDDDNWNWQKGTQQYEYWTEERLYQMEQNIILASVVTTPSERFAEYLRQLNRNVVVIPNSVPIWLTRILPPRSDRPFVIGWEGAPHHISDLTLIWEAVFKFMLRHSDVQFWLWGPNHFEELPPQLESRIRCFPWQRSVPDYYRSLDMDVALAPLLNSPFNETKSAIRVQEHSALGIPVIASPTLAYQGYLQHGSNGFFAEEASDWLDALELLYSNLFMRRKMGDRGRELARLWTTEVMAPAWEMVLGGYKNGHYEDKQALGNDESALRVIGRTIGAVGSTKS